MRPAWERLGPIRPEVAATTGLAPTTLVLNGMHDSSGNLYRYQREGLGDATLLSTGTWMVGLRAGLEPDRLEEARSMTLNADALGRPVGGVLAMVGRELEAIAGQRQQRLTRAELQQVLDAGTLALPSFVPMGGVFPGQRRPGQGGGPAVPGPALGMLICGAGGRGLPRSARGRGYRGDRRRIHRRADVRCLVKTLRPDLTVLVEPVGGGTALGAALLWTHGQAAAPMRLLAAEPIELGPRRYRDRWRHADRGAQPTHEARRDEADAQGASVRRSSGRRG